MCYLGVQSNQCPKAKRPSSNLRFSLDEPRKQHVLLKYLGVTQPVLGKGFSCYSHSVMPHSQNSAIIGCIALLYRQCTKRSAVQVDCLGSSAQILASAQSAATAIHPPSALSVSSFGSLRFPFFPASISTTIPCPSLCCAGSWVPHPPNPQYTNSISFWSCLLSKQT